MIGIYHVKPRKCDKPVFSQDRGVLSVEQAHDFQLVGVGWRRHDDVAGLEIGMLDTEMMGLSSREQARVQ